MSLPPIPEREFSPVWHEFFVSMQRELEARETRLKAAEAEITALKTRMDAVESKNTAQDASIADHETRITDLEP